jgi:oligopeptidase A
MSRTKEILLWELSLLSVLLPADGVLVRSAADDTNPLIDRLDDRFMPYDAIEAKHVVPAVDILLKESYSQLEKLEDSCKHQSFKPSAETFLKPYRFLGERLGKAYGCAAFLKSVRDSPQLRSALGAVQPRIVEYSETVSQSRPIYDMFKKLRNDATIFERLSGPQQRLVTLTLRSLDDSGVGLEGSAREELNNNTLRLSNLSTTFSQNVLDATKAWRKYVTAVDIRGLPDAPRQLAARAATVAADSLQESILRSYGGSSFLLTLDGPSVGPVLTYVENRDLRKEVLLASSEVASELQGPDNTKVLKEILAKRQRGAELLGYNLHRACNEKQNGNCYRSQGIARAPPQRGVREGKD